MFAADPRITHIPATPEQVLAVHASLNKPHIAVPGKAAQEVQAYLVSAYTAPGALTVFVYLLLASTREVVVYVDRDRLRVVASAHEEAMNEAVAFVESMGFMLEPLNLAVPPAQKAELLKTLPCFTKDLNAPAAAPDPRAAERNETPQARLARLLSAF